jgi:hypothetical protein
MARGDSDCMYNEKRYSLFLLEISFGGWSSNLTKEGFKYVGTFDTLEEAKKEQLKYDVKTIILQSH